MSKMYDSFLSYLAFRRMSKADKKAKACDARFKRSMRLLNKRKKQLKSIEKRLNAILEAVVMDVEDAENAVDASKEALDSVRSEQRITDEITIPALVQHHKLLLERVSADTAEQIRRQVVNTPMPSSMEQ